ncbi:MAG: class I SAM-dependent methyltransferase [Gemmatimonadetes bacterium]|nr:class I SAM-dependent methyltransferase [Gemmatimonadota bacterium]
MIDSLSRTNSLVRESFAPVAANYRRSRRHGDPVELRRMLGLLAPTGAERVLDIATGGGHTAAALAPFVRTVVASDLLPEMLVEARELFRAAHIRNARAICADAHSLPFAEGAFDLVTCRCAPHHFADPRRACSEVVRCLRQGGRFYLNDCGVPEDPAAGQFANEVERIRDPSHVRALSVAEWRRELEGAGLDVSLAREVPGSYSLPEWFDQIAAPPPTRARVLERLAGAPSQVRKSFTIDLTPGREVFSTLRVEAVAVRG